MERAGLTAIYESRDTAERAAVKLREAGFPAASVTVEDARASATAARAEQREELETAGSGEGLLITNARFLIGGLLGALGGLVVGVVIGAITIAATAEAPLSDGGFFLAALGAGFAAGAAAGGVIGGFRSFEHRSLTHDFQMVADAVLHVNAADLTRLAAAEEILTGSDARYIERSDPKNERLGDRRVS